MNSVFVAYPPEFAAWSKFKRKLDRILSSLSEYILLFPQDERGFVARYCEDDCRCVGCEKGEVERADYAILFDDGEVITPYVNEVRRRDIPRRIIKTPITRVVNIRRKEPYDVYIGRGSRWGNPYSMHDYADLDTDREEMSRERVIEKFRYDFERGFLRFSKEELLSLRGKRLGCYCKPKACHGDVLAEHLNAYDDGL